MLNIRYHVLSNFVANVLVGAVFLLSLLEVRGCQPC